MTKMNGVIASQQAIKIQTKNTKKSNKIHDKKQTTWKQKHTFLRDFFPSSISLAIVLCTRRPSRVVATLLAIFEKSNGLPSLLSVFNNFDRFSAPNGGRPAFFFCFFLVFLKFTTCICKFHLKLQLYCIERFLTFALQKLGEHDLARTRKTLKVNGIFKKKK